MSDPSVDEIIKKIAALLNHPTMEVEDFADNAIELLIAAARALRAQREQLNKKIKRCVECDKSVEDDRYDLCERCDTTASSPRTGSSE